MTAGSVDAAGRVVADLADGTVWVPANSTGARCRSPTSASPGSRRHRRREPTSERACSTVSPSAGADGLERLRPRPLVAGRCIKAVLIFVILVLLTLFNIWCERRVVARMQHRIGPNVNGPFGLLQ